MAEVVSLDNKPILQAPTERAKQVQILLEDIAKRNAREEIRSIVVLSVDYKNGVWTDMLRAEDSAAFLGHIEILKHDMLRRIAARREVEVLDKGDNE